MKKLFFTLILAFGLWAISANAKVKGDIHSDGVLDVSDITALVSELLSENPYSGYDVNDDGKVDVSDVTALINYILDITPIVHDYVDLGLPSGTLWATENVGDTDHYLGGLFFAWGETKGYTFEVDDGHIFDTDCYKWMMPGKYFPTDMVKYTFEDGEKNACWYANGVYVGTTVDGVTYKNLKTLLPEDDAATVNWGPEWRMPTTKEFKELLDDQYTTLDEANVNGISGLMITSKINGNSVFLSFYGMRLGKSIMNFDKGYYFTSELSYRSYSGGCVQIQPYNGDFYNVGGYHRAYGLTIRPVRNR